MKLRALVRGIGLWEPFSSAGPRRVLAVNSLSDAAGLGLMYLWALQPFGRLGWLAAFVFVACGALRLARFNVQSKIVERKDFTGLPIPMAAGIVASSYPAFQALEIDGSKNVLLLCMAFLLAFVMVSNFKYRSFKDLDFKHRLPFKYLVGGVLLISLIAWYPEVMLFVVFMSYAVLGAIFGILNIGKKDPLPANVVVNRTNFNTDLTEEVD